MPVQTYLIAVIGGLSVAAGLLVSIGLSLVIHAGVSRIADLRERSAARRERRRTLATCRAIDRLGTHHPDHRKP
ncbi:hypothetical protein [Streptomyces sp. Amel2xC10]|uniref:hypothetical protein n=1 Tax=Streptomyces sp. Amel2xC10 TaxID=1305826 RepID=UPI000A08C750|nr:hypothetical protein [Streptomyces sp. Amel2xC10]SMF85948.1 hypothetical protein SAMN02745830_07090 [Streptomyces sp. Amel2xC10]